jgi:hypothetical protein
VVGVVRRCVVVGAGSKRVVHVCRYANFQGSKVAVLKGVEGVRACDGCGCLSSNIPDVEKWKVCPVAPSDQV